MSSARDEARELLAYSHAIISCEGAAEQVIVGKLLKADALIVPAENVVDVTRKRSAAGIKEEYLNYDYPWPVCIARVLDSRTEKFALGKLYERFQVLSFITHPEIEILAVIREGAWDKWKRSGKKPSDFCKQDLGMSDIKSSEFLAAYWDVDSIIEAAGEYRKLSKIGKDELCLADLIR